MKTEEIVFQIILHAGNARSFSMEAISLAKKQQIKQAKEKIEEAKKRSISSTYNTNRFNF